MRKEIAFIIAALAGLASVSSAASNFVYQKTITPGAGNSVISGRFTELAGAPGGGLYMSSSSSDIGGYMPDPVNDSLTSRVVIVGNFGSGNSIAGIGVTPSGTAYMGGKDTATASTYHRAVPNALPNASSFTTATLASVTGLFSGPAAVNSNTIVVGSDTDGGLTFLQDTGSAFTVLNGTAVSGGVAGAKSIAYDSVGGAIYEASSGSSISGKITKFTSNGTAAGTSAGTAYQAGASTSLGDTEQGIRYQTIAVTTTSRLLAVNQNTGTAAGWAVYNLNTNLQIDFITLGSSDVPGGTALSGAAGSANQAQGVAFVEKGASTYLIVGAGSSGTTSSLYVFKYQVGAAVSDWQLYSN